MHTSHHCRTLQQSMQITKMDPRVKHENDEYLSLFNLIRQFTQITNSEVGTNLCVCPYCKTI